MNLTEIQRRNYAATQRRGLIDQFTTKQDFILKMYEEVTELAQTETDSHEAEELADIVTVCLCYAFHFDIDLMGALEAVVIKNEQRIN